MSRTLNSLRWLTVGVFLELRRRKDVYVLGLLLFVFCVGAFAVSLAGVEKPETGTFILNLGLTLAYLFAHLITLLLAARQLPAEIEHRTIYPLLARPMGRGALLAGKWLACTLAGWLAYLVFFAMVWFTAPHLESYAAGLLFQMLLLMAGSLGLAAGLALFLSLWMPKGLAMLLTGLLVFAGKSVISFASSALDTGWAQWLLLYLPDFSKLNLTTRYTDGIPALATATFLGLAAYTALFLAFVLAAAHGLLRRRPL